MSAATPQKPINGSIHCFFNPEGDHTMSAGHTMGYKMTHDNGFAPNPFHGYLTLATCKPALRRNRGKGEWVAGFASQALCHSAREQGVAIPYMGLIYLMEITEEPIPTGAYFNDTRFAAKKPKPDSPKAIERCGDNIYELLGDGRFHQLLNDFHFDEPQTPVEHSHMQHDLSGERVLVSSHFWYFGRKCWVPKGGWDRLLGDVHLSEARTFWCPDNFASKVSVQLALDGIRAGILGDPCLWEGDAAGRSGGCQSSC